MMTIRPARICDIDSIVGLLRELFCIEADFVFDPEKQRQGLQQLLNSEKDTMLVAESDNNVVGFCTLQTLISTAEGGRVGLLEDLIVAEAYRNQGIGKKLLEEALHWANSQDLKRLQLLADSNNLPALDFYIQRGWQLTQLICLRYLPPDDVIKAI